MARRGKLVLQVGAVALVALLLALLGWRVADRQAGKNVASAAIDGDKPKAPAFTLPELGREGEVSLASLRGKAVVVNFWASWCVPCRDEAPAFQAAWERWREAGVVVLGVNAQDFASDARSFIDRYGVTYPNVHDGEGSTLGDYGVTGFPETAFLDAEGRIVVFEQGPVDEADIEAGIRAALDGGAA
jgi:cytochrome c biogenesis protein CcmG/thiol:disulfide interchange protein DsbE